MQKFFNVAADCRPDMHYMVKIDRQLRCIKKKVDRGEYFIMNRARQYGKTTTLKALKEYLKDEYIVISLDFQMLSNKDFLDESNFTKSFVREMLLAVSGIEGLRASAVEKLAAFAGKDNNAANLSGLFCCLSYMCETSDKPVVLLIDEVDSATNNQVFLDFLAQLRGYYIQREVRSTFYSVILAGVYDVKNLKRKIRPEEERRTNSPWNIATKFNVDMSFSMPEICDMLQEYESDHHTGMDVKAMAEWICDYTSGYPFLVSALCKIMDEEISGTEGFADDSEVWTKKGFLEAVKILLSEKNTLFDSMVNKLEEYQELRDMIYQILFQGNTITYNPDNYSMDIGVMFGFIKVVDGIAVVSNRIFEMRFYNYFLSLAEMQNTDIYKRALQDKYCFVENGTLNMERILERFVICFSELYGNRDEKFLEDDGRRFFLLFLRPIINGIGNYYIEAQTRDSRRTDVIIDYLGKQYIVELKIWHGEEYNRRGEEQLGGYLDVYHLKKGYMLSFNFNQNKKAGVKKVFCGDKTVIEAVV